jgi:hypothetical protein
MSILLQILEVELVVTVSGMSDIFLGSIARRHGGWHGWQWVAS